ncbi:MAG: hypothetical protein H6658_04305 [Ardenticatenaceae bacterium]|nr:hypothetical protein [Ardenticatenaceae bacterium]
MLDIFRDPVWDGIAGVITILGVFIGIIFALFPSMRPKIIMIFTSKAFLYFLSILTVMGIVLWIGILIGQRRVQVEGENVSQRVTLSHDNFCTEFGIEIQRYEIVSNGIVKIIGSLENIPPSGVFRLVITDDILYWPQTQHTITISDDGTYWEGFANTRGGQFVTAYLLGEGGRAIVKYYHDTGSIDDSFYGIALLPPDMYECDRIFIPVRD